MSTSFQLHQIVAVSPETGGPVSGAELSIFVDDGSGGRGALVGSVFGVGGESVPQPITSGADGIIRFRLPAGTYFLELEHGSNLTTRPGFMSGNASARDTGTGSSQLPLPENLPAALLGRVAAGSDARRFFAFNSSAAYVLSSLFDVTPVTDRTAAKVLAVDGAASGLEWVTLPTGNLPPLTGQEGRVLRVDNVGEDVEWVSALDLVFPSFTGQGGRVLRVGSREKDVEWVTANPPYIINLLTTTGDRTVVAGDHNTILEASQTGPINYVLALDSVESVPVGTLLTVVNVGTGEVSVSAATGVTLNGVDGLRVSMNNRWDAATLYKRSADEWVISGKFGTPP